MIKTVQIGYILKAVLNLLMGCVGYKEEWRWIFAVLEAEQLDQRFCHSTEVVNIEEELVLSGNKSQR